METLMRRLAQVLVVGGLISLIIGVIVDISGVNYWHAYPSGWFEFTIACGILAMAMKYCWTCTKGDSSA